MIFVSSAGNFGQEIVVYPAGAAERRGRRIRPTPPRRRRGARSATTVTRSSASARRAQASSPPIRAAAMRARGARRSARRWRPAPPRCWCSSIRHEPDRAAALLGRAEPIDPAGMGKGRLNLFEALRTVNDETAPSVAFTAPTGGTVASESIVVSASASDNLGVAGVKFLLDNNPLGAEDTSAPYEVTWNDERRVERRARADGGRPGCRGEPDQRHSQRDRVQRRRRAVRRVHEPGAPAASAAP